MRRRGWCATSRWMHRTDALMADLPLGAVAPQRDGPSRGLYRVEVLAIDGMRFQVKNLDAIDGNPVLDVKLVRAGASDS